MPVISVMADEKDVGLALSQVQDRQELIMHITASLKLLYRALIVSVQPTENCRQWL